jgi:hypothetical protein
MSTEIKRIKVDKDTRIEPILQEAGDGPVIIEFGNAAYRVNPLGNTSSPFTVESAYASVRTVDGHRGADISDEELEDMIDEAKEPICSAPYRGARLGAMTLIDANMFIRKTSGIGSTRFSRCADCIWPTRASASRP